MRRILVLAAGVMLLAGCGNKESELAQQMLQSIESQYAKGEYRVVLDSIKKLREKFPEAIEQRKKALEIWQEASLKITQADIAVTDSALQTVARQMQAATDIATRNKLGVIRDSLQVRYEALCGTVRVIHKRQEMLPR